MEVSQAMDGVKQQLLSNTLKTRREGVKQLDRQLDSPLFLHALDANTAKLWPEDRLTLATWPGLVDMFMGYVVREVIDHGKQPDSNGIKVLHRIFMEAANPDRCGPGSRHLLRRAGVAFEKMHRILEKSQPGQGLATALGKEFVSILHKVLLPNAEYCQRSNVLTFQGLIEEVMCRCEDLIGTINRTTDKDATGAAGSSRLSTQAAVAALSSNREALAAENELYTLVGLLAGLLGGVPGQLVTAFAFDLAGFLAASLHWCNKQRRFGRLDIQFLACLNGLLLLYGADLRTDIGIMYKQMHEYVKRAWGERSARLKECVLCYCRVALALGGPQSLGDWAVRDLLSLVTRDINSADTFTWDLQGNKQHQLLAALAASLHYHQAFTSAPGSEPSQTNAEAAAAAATVMSHPPEGSSEGSSGAGLGRGTKRRKRTAAAPASQAEHASGQTHAYGAKQEHWGDKDRDGAGSEDQLVHLPRKRSRVMAPDSQLLEMTQKQPERWGPVMTLLLHIHGPLLPMSFHAAVLRMLSQTISSILSSLRASTVDGGDAVMVGAAAGAPQWFSRSVSPADGASRSAVAAGAGPAVASSAKAAALGQQQQLQWLLRCACEVILCWPAALHPLSAVVADAHGVCGTYGNACTSEEAAAAAPGSQTLDRRAASGSIGHQRWTYAGGKAATAACAQHWKEIWDAIVGAVSSADMHVVLLVSTSGVNDDLVWLLHALLARKLVLVDSKHTALAQLSQLLLIPQQQQPPPQQARSVLQQQLDDQLQHLPDAQQQQQQQHQFRPLAESQLALLLSLCLEERTKSQSEIGLRQQLLQACLDTAEVLCSNSGSRPYAGAQSRAGTSSAIAAAAAARGQVLPDLLLPAILALLEAPGLPTPGLNGCVTFPSAAAAGGTGTQASAAGLPDRHCATRGADTIWYHASLWWPADRRVERLIEGLEPACEYLQRKLAASQLQQLLIATDLAADGAGSGLSTLPLWEAQPLAPGGTVADDTTAATAGVEGSGRWRSWWKCWRQLADRTAETLCQALSALLPDGHADQVQYEAMQQDQQLSSAPAVDPVRKLCHLLLLANSAANLPCIASLRLSQTPRSQQQQNKQQQPWHGLHPATLSGLHLQLQKLMLQGLEYAGQLFRDVLSDLPCAPGSTWLQQLLHLGTSLARLQRITSLDQQQLSEQATASASITDRVTEAACQAVSSQEIAMAAAGIMQAVVLQLEQVFTAAAAEAVAAPDNPEFKKMRTSRAGDVDLDDDFMGATPAVRPTGGVSSTQQTAGYGTQSMAAPAAGGAAAAGTLGAASGPSYAVLMSGGLGGFAGRACEPSGSTVFMPALAPADYSSSPSTPAVGFRHCFACGGLGEGLTGVTGAQGAGLRVLAALSPACGPDAAQGLLQLWIQLSGMGGGAPSELLLEAFVETMCAAVCAGGWVQLTQLFGLIRGSHTLLAAQKVPLSTLHLLLRLLQQVAVAAAATGHNLDAPKDVFLARMSQGSAQQDVVVDEQQLTLLGDMIAILDDVHSRLQRLLQTLEGGKVHKPWPQSVEMQQALTTLALLQLQPEVAYSSATANAASTGQMEGYRAEVLELLCCSSHALRIRAGPLAQQLLVDTAAVAATQQLRNTSDEQNNGAAGAGSYMVSAAVSAALADIQQYLVLQTSPGLNSQQQQRLNIMQQVATTPVLGNGPQAHSVVAEHQRQAGICALTWETAVAQVTDLAEAAGMVATQAVQLQEPPNVLDAQLLVLLLSHTAGVHQLPAEVLPATWYDYKASMLDLCAQALDLMASQQHYTSRLSYLAVHAAVWVWQWFLKDRVVQELLLLCPLICSSNPVISTVSGSLAGHQQASLASKLLDLYGSSIIPSLLHQEQEHQLQLLAQLAGFNTAELCSKYRWQVFGTLYPMVKFSSLKERVDGVAGAVGQPHNKAVTMSNTLEIASAMFVMALPSLGTVPLLWDNKQQQQQQQERLWRQQLQAWTAAAERQELMSVFYPRPVVQQATLMIGNSLSPNNKEGSWLQKARLTPTGVQALLLSMHKNTIAACHPAHRLQRLGQIEAVLTVLQPQEVTAPAVARYLASMLLQQLHVPALQPACCDMLLILYQQLYAAIVAREAAAPQDSKGGSKTATATERQQQLLQQQLALGVLSEVLPPTVAALVQCIESAAAAQQMQHEQAIWQSVQTTAGVLAARSIAADSGAVDLHESCPPVALLLFLLTNPPKALLPVVQAVDLLPPIPVLAKPAALQQQLLQGLQQLQRVVQFAERASGMAASSRERMVQGITAQLQHDDAVLYVSEQPGRSSGSNRNSTTISSNSRAQDKPSHATVDPTLTEAALRLAKLGAKLADKPMIELAGQLLAISGPLHPDVITFDAATATAGVENNSYSSKSRDIRDRVAFPMQALLQHLVNCLFDSQPQLVQVAQATLQQLLATSQAATVLQALQKATGDATSAVLHSYLSTFAGPGAALPDARNDADKSQLASEALAAATSALLWSPVGKGGYDNWLCQTCSTLLSACGTIISTESSMLQLLADAAALQPQLAELLLPHALLHLCSSDGSGTDLPGVGSLGLAAQLGNCITQGLQLSRNMAFTGSNSSNSSDQGTCLSPAVAWQCSAAGSQITKGTSGIEIRCLAALLACLEHNRLVHRAAMMTPLGQEPPPPAAWRRCFCLHIDYQAVAAAAVACRAYFTALIYIEHWCEEQYGRLMLRPPEQEASPLVTRLQQLGGVSGNVATAIPVTQQQQDSVLEQLLLDLYSNVNEPDGIYAVAAVFSSSSSQLQLLKHEQQWDMVLGAEDAALQTVAVQQQPGGSLTGVLTALQQLGCQVTAHQCLQAALRNMQQQQQKQQQQRQISDAQYQLAWRLSDWNIADAIGPHHGRYSSEGADTAMSPASLGPGSLGAAHASAGPAASAGFHGSVLSALRALQKADTEGFASSLSGARQECVLHLVRRSTQSAAAVNPMLVQLQMLRMLQQAASFTHSGGNPAAAGAGLDSAEAMLVRFLGQDYMPGGVSAAAQRLSSATFQLSDQLMTLQAALAKVLRRPDALALTLQGNARMARKANQGNFASAALNQLQQLLQQASAAAAAAHTGGAAGMLSGTAGVVGGDRRGKLPGWLTQLTAPDAPWLLEFVKLQWQQGQQQPAFRELQGLLAALKARHTQQQQQCGQSGISRQALHAATALMKAQALAGQWMAAGQFSSSADDVVSLLQDAAAIAASQQRLLQHNVQQSSQLFSLSGLAGSPIGSVQELAHLHCQVFFQYASYADQRYRELELQMASPEWQKQHQVLESKREMLREIDTLLHQLRKLPPQKQSNPQVVQQLKKLGMQRVHIDRQVARDADIISQLQAQRDQSLLLAMANYRSCLAAGGSHDLQVVYRLCSLWFKQWQDPEINGQMMQVFETVSSAKFVPLVYQIASRLDSSSSTFQAALTAALKKLALEHPYHSMYPLIALKNGNESKDKGTLLQFKTDLSKVEASANLLESLKSEHPDRLKGIVDEMIAQVQVYIEITAIQFPKNAQGQITANQATLPGALRRRLLSCTKAPPICLSLPLDPTGRYEDVPHVVDIDTTIRFAGGINAPLVLRTTDSTGRPQRQLVKSGNDDLRQDAVMQQFFGLVNDVLASSPASRQRRLGIRTYRVVPCSPIVGLVEWVEGTVPMIEWLAAGSQREGGACARYRKPGSLTWLDCWKKLSSAKAEELREAFLYVRDNFPPVFHNFFLENFPDPARWFEARITYTRSTAVSSMAGSIIGLGDRHMGNMLLDANTAEVVHIDLGIAFEQGLFLNTPERVPFRLTANVIDGMGAAGVEGPFRRCCETTMEILRSHKEALLTVVEVVLHDPLYKWQMTPVKARRKQQDTIADANVQEAAAAASGAVSSASGGQVGDAGSAGAIGNADAERAVLRVKQKLEGQDVEGGVAQSVSAQVGMLLQAAQDPDNLCRMFAGWAAFT